MLDVVAVGPLGWTVTAREAAATVSNHDHSIDAGRHGSSRAGDVQHSVEAVDGHHREGGIARYPESGLGGYDARLNELAARRCRRTGERLLADD
jgi:hypothetical protein